MKIVFITGAGISAESGIPTYRDAMGLWKTLDPMEVAHIDGWNRNPEKLIDFHNKLRSNINSSEPNQAHNLIAKLEEDHDVHVITTNVDELHESAGSTNVLHIHGSINEYCKEEDRTYVERIPLDAEIELHKRTMDGSFLRPNVVWFGEDVIDYYKASRIVSDADMLVVVGSSLNVPPSCYLVDECSSVCNMVFINPEGSQSFRHGDVAITEKATSGMEILNNLIKNDMETINNGAILPVNPST
jgi:NAD-dependent deacetylase